MLKAFGNLCVADSAQYPVITANEVPRDQRIHRAASHGSHDDTLVVKKARKHRDSRGTDRSRGSRASGSKRTSLRRPEQVQRESSALTSSQSTRDQLVDLVVEDEQAEEQDRIQARKETGSEWPEADNMRFQ